MSACKRVDSDRQCNVFKFISFMLDSNYNFLYSLKCVVDDGIQELDIDGDDGKDID